MWRGGYCVVNLPLPPPKPGRSERSRETGRVRRDQRWRARLSAGPRLPGNHRDYRKQVPTAG